MYTGFDETYLLGRYFETGSSAHAQAPKQSEWPCDSGWVFQVCLTELMVTVHESIQTVHDVLLNGVTAYSRPLQKLYRLTASCHQ